ncbi:MAG: hypothetical protein QXW79_01095 [Thermoplasmata archaeon]
MSTENRNRIKDYYNPYECGAKQNLLDPCYIPYIKPNRNVNMIIPSLQTESFRLPGRRKMIEKEINRFEFLPFNPQDPNHIVWSDMPRGGFATRNDRLEIRK